MIKNHCLLKISLIKYFIYCLPNSSLKLYEDFMDTLHISQNIITMAVKLLTPLQLNKAQARSNPLWNHFILKSGLNQFKPRKNRNQEACFLLLKQIWQLNLCVLSDRPDRNETQYRKTLCISGHNVLAESLIHSKLCVFKLWYILYLCPHIKHIDIFTIHNTHYKTVQNVIVSCKYSHVWKKSTFNWQYFNHVTNRRLELSTGRYMELSACFYWIFYCAL